MQLAPSSRDIASDVKQFDPLGRGRDRSALGLLNRRSTRHSFHQFLAQRSARPKSFRDSGRSDEWHLNRDKPFGHIAFELVAGFSQVRDVSVVSFLSPGLVAIGAIGDAVGGDGVEQDLVQA